MNKMLKVLIPGAILFTLCMQQAFSQSADTTHPVKASIPTLLKGTFEDEHGIRYTINDILLDTTSKCKISYRQLRYNRTVPSCSE